MSELVERLRHLAWEHCPDDVIAVAADRIAALEVFAAEVYDLAGPTMDTERHIAAGAPLTQVALDQLRHRIETLEAQIADLSWVRDNLDRLERRRNEEVLIARALERERLAKLAAPVLHYLDWQREVQAGRSDAAPLAAARYSRSIGEVWRDVNTFAAAIRAGEGT